jgi:hypothetical protein
MDVLPTLNSSDETMLGFSGQPPEFCNHTYVI